MTGLIYKECKQNRFLLIATAVLPLLVFFLPVAVLRNNEGLAATARILTEERGKTVMVLFVIVGYLLVGAMQTFTYMGDDSKKWGYFMVSNPEGIKGYIYAKYMLILGMSMLFVFSMEMGEMLYGIFFSQVTKQSYVSMSAFFVLLFYLQLFLRAVDLPFVVRFGMKQGSMIKMILFIAVLLVILIIFAVIPDLMIAFIETVEKLMENDNGMLVLTGVFPYVSIGMFVLSYQISCKLYMKGVEHYDK